MQSKGIKGACFVRAVNGGQMCFGEPAWKEATTLLMAMTGHRSQEPVKTIFKMQFDLLLWHYKFFFYLQIMSERPVCGENKNVDVYINDGFGLQSIKKSILNFNFFF